MITKDSELAEMDSKISMVKEMIEWTNFEKDLWAQWALE